ncbi:cytochrome P450 [Apiospora arundinis]|uniref:Cytochrome P450 n=1 Tax=Apiospora arundinis TaxID=335852 RepID=A0ABR2HQG2_9PEZI
MGHNQKALEHLYQEVKDMDVTNAKKLANEETLRLYPALITGGSRMARQKDMVVAGRWIPPYTTIVAPPYLIARITQVCAGAVDDCARDGAQRLGLQAFWNWSHELCVPAVDNG